MSQPPSNPIDVISLEDIYTAYQSFQPQLQVYEDLLVKWNQKINLTAIRDRESIRKLHFMDGLAACLAVERYFVKQNVSRETISLECQNLRAQSTSEGVPFGIAPLRMMDIGSGNGIPGILLKLYFPQSQMTLVEAVEKKCLFMKTVGRDLSLLLDVQHGHLYWEEGQDLKFFHQLKLLTPQLLVSRAAFPPQEWFSLGQAILSKGDLLLSMFSSDQWNACRGVIYHAPDSATPPVNPFSLLNTWEYSLDEGVRKYIVLMRRDF